MRGEGESCFKTDEVVSSQGLASSSPTCWINFPLANGRIMQAGHIQTTCLYTPPWQGNSGAATRATSSSIAETLHKNINKLVKRCCLSLPQR